MKKIIGVFFLTIMFLAGCPSFVPQVQVSDFRILSGGAEKTSVTIEEGQTIAFTANTGFENTSIVWELNNASAAITGSGEGENCSIKGIAAGSAVLTVKAWQNPDDTPVTKSVNITVITSQVTDIILTSSTVIGAGEERPLSWEIVPAWAGGASVTWSVTANAQITGGGTNIKGQSSGNAVLTAAAGGFVKNFNIEVKNPDALSNLFIYSGNTDVTNTTLEIGLYEELQLSAIIAPENSYTFFTWASSNSSYVSVTPNGVIKGLRTTAGSSAVIITVNAGGKTSSVDINVKNPVTGIRVRFDNLEKLPVNNTIWLYPGEQVNLEAVLAPAGITGDVIWSGANSEVSISASGATCTLTGGSITRFDAAPTEVRISAMNAGNSGKPVTAILRVKTQPKPIWAWERGRDHNTIAGSNLLSDGTPPSLTYTLTGRGDYTSPIPLSVFGNDIPYTSSGLKINSSNNTSGNNPDPSPDSSRSTRIAFGTNNRTNTAAIVHTPGVFNLSQIGGTVRISVDYEIIWSAGAGRNMWITVNNNQANAANSVLGTSSQALIHPITAPRGTRDTAIATVNIDDFVQRRVPGYESLQNAIIGIVLLSNGGSVYVSGIRIERED